LSAVAKARRSRRRLLTAVVPACALVSLTLVFGLAGGGPVAASGQLSAPQDAFQTDDAVPATEVLMLGASPQETKGETWGIGKEAGTESYAIVRYTTAGGWTRAPAILNGSGEPLAGFAPAASVTAGGMTPGGAGIVFGFVEKAKVMLIRNPGQPFQEAKLEPTPEAGKEAILDEGEELFASKTGPLATPLEEGSSAGALVVPAGTGEGEGASKKEPIVLHWEAAAERWTREPIELPEAARKEGGFQALGIAAGSPTNAWLLARVSSSSKGVSLFRRVPGAEGTPGTWQPVKPGSGYEAAAPLSVGGVPVTLELEPGAQSLTVTEQGIWVDGERGSDAVTLFFAPTGAGEGEVKGSWCEEGCTHTLPEELPLENFRSYAWAGSSTFGERIITGLPGGAFLRLEGEEFTRVLTVGSPAEPEDVGVSDGAAFSTAFEGWLGNSELPVHVTLEPQPESLIGSYWPVPFDKPLLAVAAEPGVAVGAISSEALAVGERGEVSRYVPGEGWEPESLFEPAGQRAEPQLRGVAWPTPSRAYAVGVNSSGVGEMWLWRGETGLWEPDPATPLNFREDLLGIAFAPSEPSRGYAVGQSETLLRYGKTWTQEADLPAEVAGANFTSIAFAGSEALVAYRVPHLNNGGISYTGGVLANAGSGWHVDSEVAAALPSGYVPWAVAGLADGGAALSASVPGGNQQPLVLERNAPGSAWEQSPVPYPGRYAPGSLALFREDGALRVVGAGSIPDTVQVDSVTPAPAGFPPDLLEPYPLALGNGLLRQTADGWTDEEPERRLQEPPPGGYVKWDIPYSPDPTAAVLLNETGTSGWAVGGLRQKQEGADTADIARYPADGSVPPGVGTESIGEIEPKEGEKIATVGPNGEDATFALGGGSQCAAPCSNFANARIGPDVWLSSALERVAQVDGVRGFLYAGPRVTTGATSGHATLAIPYTREFERYGALLRSGPSSLPVDVAPASTDHIGSSLCAFEAALQPFGVLPDEAFSAGSCEEGQSAYYAFTSGGGGQPQVRVIVLDDSKYGTSESEGGVSPTQLTWLSRELAQAKSEGPNSEGIPAIVLGSANLYEEAEVKHEAAATRVIETLKTGQASAYLFYDSEKNVELKLGSIPAFGTGTLGYVNQTSAEESDFIGASGFLLVVVEAGKRVGTNNVVPVTASLIPDLGELSLQANDGTLLRRSEAAMFSALARRPRAGGVGSQRSNENLSTDFVPIPSNCQGSDCPPAGEGILPEFKFSSSDPETGEFVKPNLASGETNGVLLGKGKLGGTEEPIPDAKSGLFCAYNKGQTKVKIEAGGLYAELLVTVQAGSVRRPCGTTPLKVVPAKTTETSVPAPAPAPAPAPSSSPALTPLVPVPPAPAVAPPAPPARVPAALPTLLLPPIQAVPASVIVPPPLPPVAEPTPPSGTSAVTSPVEAAQREEEQEEATESVSAQAVAYQQAEQEPASAYLLGLIVLAALAGATIRRRTRRDRREVRVAPATISTARSQRRMSRHGRQRW
jgi:hypothetical protein